jgi:CheY-like chemotaxis protein
MARVLIADDDADIRAVMRDVLEMQSHIVLEAEDAARTLTCLTASDEPLVALVDLRMPGFSIAELVARVLEEPNTVAGRHGIVFMSADVRALETVPCDDLPGGICVRLVKPFDVDRLTALVAEMAARLAAPALRAPLRADGVS